MALVQALNEWANDLDEAQIIAVRTAKKTRKRRHPTAQKLLGTEIFRQNARFVFNGRSRLMVTMHFLAGVEEYWGRKLGINMR